MPATVPAFDLTVVCSGDRWCVLARGELDLRYGHDLVDVAAALAAAGVTEVELDLGEVTFIDAAGWRAVGDARSLLAERGVAARVGERSEAVRHFVDALVPVVTDG